MRLIRLLCLCVPLISASITHAGFDRGRDLVALHYDHAPDRDDAHAAVAGLMVSQSMDLQVIVVGGAYGRWNADRYDAASEAVMDATWGAAWLNAHTGRDAAFAASVERWLQTLNSGADVWVAEGGQSDLTASIVRQIQQALPGVDTNSRIHVVQHSDWNEVHADQSDLGYVRSNTDYMRIEDGNFANATADLNQQSQTFVDAVLASQYATAWRAAFTYLSPGSKLDFSDAVELLHIVGVGPDQVRTPDDFAARFIGDGSVIYQPPTAPMYWSDSYSVDGQCFCDTNFDHGLDAIFVDTPAGSFSVVRICDDIRRRYGEGSASGRLYYNTVQCGHEPANNAPDESNCPGFLTDSSGTFRDFSCNATGARWNLERLYPDTGSGTDDTDASDDGQGGSDDNSTVDGISDDGGQTVDQSGSTGSNDDGQSESDDSSTVDRPSDDGGQTSDDGNNPGGSSGDNTGGSGDVPGEVFTDSGTDFPDCLLTDSDPDGDGFGWEDGRSCLIQNGGSIEEPGINEQDAEDSAGSPAANDQQGDGSGVGSEVIGVGAFSFGWLFLAGYLASRRRIQVNASHRLG